MSAAASEAPSRTSLALRIVRCSLLRADTYEEVEADVSSLVPAAVLVGLAAASSGAGAWLETLTWQTAGDSALGLGIEIATRTLEPLALWLGGAAFAYMVGSSFFRGEHTDTDYAEVLRTTGFAFAPQLLAVAVALPPAGLGLGIVWLVRVWVIVAFTVAVRHALDFTTGRAVGTVALGWILGWLVMWGGVSVLLQVLS